MKNRKQRKMVVLLSFVVVIVWSLIIKQLVGYLGGPEMKDVSEEEQLEMAKQLTDSLLLNYRDPFVSAGEKKPEQLEQLHFPISGEISPPSPPAFRMVGKIRKGVKDFLLIEKADGSLLVEEGTLVDGFHIRRIFSDSVIVSRAGECYTLVLK